MLITTTSHIEDHKITRYCGIVAGETIVGTHIFKDLLGGLRNLLGGRSKSYEKALQQAREIAVKEMWEQASLLGANAVVGVDIDYEVLGVNNGLLMVTASGTAVEVVEIVPLPHSVPDSASDSDTAADFPTSSID